jgi:hypothetical protein
VFSFGQTYPVKKDRREKYVNFFASFFYIKRERERERERDSEFTLKLCAVFCAGA